MKQVPGSLLARRHLATRRFGQNVLNAHFPISGFAVKGLIKISKFVYPNQLITILCKHGKALGIPRNREMHHVGKNFPLESKNKLFLTRGRQCLITSGIILITIMIFRNLCYLLLIIQILQTDTQSFQFWCYTSINYTHLFICSTTVISTRYSRSYTSSRIGGVYWGYYSLYYYQAGLYSRRPSYPSGEQLLPERDVFIPITKPPESTSVRCRSDTLK